MPHPSTPPEPWDPSTKPKYGHAPSDGEVACEKCGWVHDRCSAHKTTGEPCGNRPMAGHTVCRRTHGRAPQIQRKAAENVERERIRTEIAGLLAEMTDEARGLHPIDSLEDARARAHAMASLVAERLTSTDLEGVPGAKGGMVRTVLEQMLTTWTDMQAKSAKLALDAGIDERRTQLAEREQEQVAQVLRAFVGFVCEMLEGCGAAPAAEQLRSEWPGLMRRAAIEAEVIE